MIDKRHLQTQAFNEQKRANRDVTDNTLKTNNVQIFSNSLKIFGVEKKHAEVSIEHFLLPNAWGVERTDLGLVPKIRLVVNAGT